MLPFRLYYSKGCRYCEKAVALLESLQAPFQRVEITGDPIASKGIKAALDTDVIPVFVSFHSKEVVKGFRADEYIRLVAAYRGAGKLNMDIGAKHDIGTVEIPVPTEAI